jgi:predicted enzyme related to lactoylglutathione lyase
MACFPNDEGAISLSPGFRPSENGVLVSLDVGNRLDDALDFVVSNGGRILKPRTKIEAEGRDYFALFIDTEGNRMGLYGK